MATISHSVTGFGTLGQRKIVKWENLSDGDDGEPYDIGDAVPVAVQIVPVSAGSGLVAFLLGNNKQASVADAWAAYDGTPTSAPHRVDLPLMRWFMPKVGGGDSGSYSFYMLVSPASLLG